MAVKIISVFGYISEVTLILGILTCTVHVFYFMFANCVLKKVKHLNSIEIFELITECT